MIRIHVSTPEVSFDVDVPRGRAMLRAIELADETDGDVTVVGLQ